MGIGIVLLFWLFAGIIAAAIGAVVLAVGMTVLTRKGQEGRRGAIVMSAALPFIGLLWFAGVFVFQATVNAVVFQRDPGLGDAWVTPLPNGYHLTMIDVTDRGWVHKSTQMEMGPQISDLQIADRYILARYTSETGGYFLLDTVTGKHQEFADVNQLQMTAKPLGISLNLEPINTVYGRYRNSWFDYLVLLLFLAYPVGALVVWVRRVRRVRQEREELFFEPT